jgi:hypothetical protein
VPPRILLAIDIGERLPVGVKEDEAGRRSSATDQAAGSDAPEEQGVGDGRGRKSPQMGAASSFGCLLLGDGSAAAVPGPDFRNKAKWSRKIPPPQELILKSFAQKAQIGYVSKYPERTLRIYGVCRDGFFAGERGLIVGESNPNRPPLQIHAPWANVTVGGDVGQRLANKFLDAELGASQDEAAFIFDNEKYPTVLRNGTAGHWIKDGIFTRNRFSTEAAGSGGQVIKN